MCGAALAHLCTVASSALIRALAVACESQGIAYLRAYLHMPEDVVPNTLKKSTRTQPAPSFATQGTVEGEGGVFNGAL